MIRRAAHVCIAVLALCGACTTSGDDDATPTTRPPLGDPPDPGPAPDHHGLTAADVERLAASTFRIFGIGCGRTSEGSGFAVSDEVVVTNAHVLVGVAQPQLELADGTRVDAAVVGLDLDNDLALLRVAGAGFEPLALGEAADGTVGGLFGWDSGPELQVTPFRVDRPVTVKIEAVGRDDEVSRPSYLLAADVEAGDSGAPLIDADGTVVGVAYMSTTRNASVGYAVRTQPVAALLERGVDEGVDVPDCVTTRSDGSGEDGS